MSAHPRTVAAETWILWDGAPQRLARGQVIDVTPGGALERAIGRDRLVSPRGMPLPPPEAPAEVAAAPEPAPAKSRATSKKQDNDGDGEP